MPPDVQYLLAPKFLIIMRNVCALCSIFLLFSLSIVSLTAQNSNLIADSDYTIDSLNRRINKSSNDIDLINRLGDLGQYYLGLGKSDFSRDIANKMLGLAEKNNYLKGKINAKIIKSETLVLQQELDSAMLIYRDLYLTIDSAKYPIEYFNLMKNIGLLYQIQGMKEVGLQYALKTKVIAENLNDTALIIKTLNNIGVGYYSVMEFEKAIEHYLLMLKLLDKQEQYGSRIRAYVNLGNAYNQLEKFQEAQRYYELAIELGEVYESHTVIGFTYIGLADLNAKLNDYKKAMNYGEKASELFLSAGDITGYNYSKFKIGRYYYAIGDHEKALDLYIEVYENIKDRGNISYFLDLLKSKSEALKALNQYESAYETLQEYSEKREVQYNDEMEKSALLSKVQQNFERKQAEVKAEQERKDALNRLVLIALGIGVVGLLIFSSVVLYQKHLTRKQQLRAERSEKIKQQFLANMSHEIRTPMNAIIGMTNLTLQSPLNPKQEQYLTNVKKASENLLHIINDILDFSKIEDGKMTLEHINFNLNDIISQIIHTLQHKADEKGLTLVKTIDPMLPEIIKGDPVRLYQILMNLMGNAIKFTAKGSVQLDVKLDERNDTNSVVTFSILDTGIGIPQDKIDTIFESFTQANYSDTRNFGGTGLGLSISRQLVELMGGRLQLESEVGFGSRFYFTLNLEQGSEVDLISMLNHHNIDGHILDDLHILLVDDNQDNRIVCRDTLELVANIHIDEATNGQEAISMVKSNPYDLILMDVQMPVMGGLEATGKIRNELQAPLSDIPVIALTASVIKSDIDQCRKAGMNDYLPKPFSTHELIRTIANYTGREIKYIDVKKNDPITSVETEGYIGDLTYLTQFCNNDAEKMKKYISIYTNSVPAFLSQIETFLADKNTERLSALIHSFKTKLMMMGLKEGHALAGEIELYFKEENASVESVEGKINQLCNIVKSASHYLKDHYLMESV